MMACMDYKKIVTADIRQQVAFFWRQTTAAGFRCLLTPDNDIYLLHEERDT